MKNDRITVIAGPCSVDKNNLKEIVEIGEITVKNRKGELQKAIAGTRVVGLKSRTEYDTTGKGMGIDFPAFKKNMEILTNGGNVKDFETPPSVIMAEEIVKKTNMLVATEVMVPSIQLPVFEGRIPKNKLMPWNPAVDQLGWTLLELAMYAKRNGWHIGIKNGKWIGDHLYRANTDTYSGKTTMEKTWAGLASYADNDQGDIILIHRGVDVPDKGEYRNAVVHEIAKRTKLTTKKNLYFDPSHTHGPKLKHHIVSAVIDAMKMKINNNEYLYDGILVETGTSTTDTEQHITIEELRTLVQVLATFRDLVSPEPIPTKKNKNLFGEKYQFA